MKFTVIIPTYNRKHLLHEAISSVLEQKGMEIQIIIVDDGSTDGTVNWINKEYSNKSIKVIPNNRTKGPAGARNTGLLAANDTDFIALLDSDDCFLLNHLSQALEVFEKFQDVDVIFGRAEYRQNGEVVDYMGPNFDLKLGFAPVEFKNDQLFVFTTEIFTHLLEHGCYFNLSTVVFRSTVKELMDEKLRIAEDYEFWVRLSRNHRFACLNTPQITYTLHDDNISFEQDASIENNSPSLISAYQIILNYPSLEKKQIQIIKEHIASIFFSWGYRCRLHGKLNDSIRLHIQSLSYGSYWINVKALIKVIVIALFPILNAKQ